MEGYEYALAESRNPDGMKVKNMTPHMINESNIGVAIRTIKEFYKQK